MLLSRQEYVDIYATSMKDRLLAAARAKAKELQQEAADKIDKIDKGIKGDAATLAHDAQSEATGSAQSEATGSAQSEATGSTPDDEGRPPTSQGDERAAS
jgi:1-acyl-sn-glycerol-3-phosphate acyltransferase